MKPMITAAFVIIATVALSTGMTSTRAWAGEHHHNAAESQRYYNSDKKDKHERDKPVRAERHHHDKTAGKHHQHPDKKDGHDQSVRHKRCKKTCKSVCEHCNSDRCKASCAHCRKKCAKTAIAPGGKNTLPSTMPLTIPRLQPKSFDHDSYDSPERFGRE